MRISVTLGARLALVPIALLAVLVAAAGCHRGGGAGRAASTPPVSPEVAAAADAAFECALTRVQGLGFVLTHIERGKRTAEAASEDVSAEQLTAGPRDVDYLRLAVYVVDTAGTGRAGPVAAVASGESQRVRAEGRYDDPQHTPYVVRNPITTSGRVHAAERTVRSCAGAGTRTDATTR